MFLDTWWETLKEAVVAVPFGVLMLAVAVLFVIGSGRVLNYWTKGFNDNEAIFKHGNWAYGVQRLCLAVAQVFAMLPVLHRFDPDVLWNSLGWLALEGSGILILLLASRKVADWVILRGIDNLQELKNGNMAVGIVEGSFYLGFGVIINASLTGGAPSILVGYASALFYSLLGLAVMVGVCLLHTTIHRLHGALEQRSIVAALEVATFLVTVPIVVRAGVADDFHGWVMSTAIFFAMTIIALSLLYPTRWLLQFCLYADRTVRGQSAKAATLEGQQLGAVFVAGCMIALSLATAAVISSQV